MQRLPVRSGAYGDSASGEAFGSPRVQRRWHGPGRVVLANFALALVLTGLLAIVYAGTFGVDAADDIFFSQSRNGTYDLALANYVNGRFVPGAIFQMLSASGIDIQHIWTALQFLAIASVAVFSIVFVTRLALPLSHLETLPFAGLIASFPYLVALIANKNNALNATLAYAAAAAAVYFHSKLRGWARVAVPACFLFICVSSYQTIVYYFVVFVIGLQLFHGACRREALLPLATGAAAIAAAFATYFIVYRASVDWALLHMAQSDNRELAVFYGNPRSQMNHLLGVAIAAFLYVASIARVLVAPEPILPLVLKVLAVLTFMASYRRWNDGALPGLQPPTDAFVRRKQRLLVLGLIVAVGSPIHLAINNIWLAPRVLAHSGAVWAVLLAAALVLGPTKWRGRIMFCVTVLFLGLAASTYTVVRDGQRLHDRDMALGREIFAQLQRTRQFDPDLPVAVVGLLDATSSYMANTWSYYNLNTSKFGNEWSKRVTLEAAAGRRFALPDSGFVEIAKHLCASGKTEHGPFSTAVTRQGAVVCLR